VRSCCWRTRRNWSVLAERALIQHAGQTRATVLYLYCVQWLRGLVCRCVQLPGRCCPVPVPQVEELRCRPSRRGRDVPGAESDLLVDQVQAFFRHFEAFLCCARAFRTV